MSQNRQFSVASLKAFWWKPEDGAQANFGDALNEYLIEKMTGQKPQWTLPTKTDTTYVCIGSVLNHLFYELDNCIIWGAGFIVPVSAFKSFLKRRELPTPRKICAVRGVLTRKIFMRHGIDCPKVFGDPALLLPLYFDPKVDMDYIVGVIPHHADRENPWFQSLKNIENALVIDVGEPIEVFVKKVKSCKVIISSSLHGLAVADAYRKPSVWIRVSDNLIGADFKFLDYYSAHGVKRKALDLRGKATIRLSEVASAAVNINSRFDAEALLAACPFSRKH